MTKHGKKLVLCLCGELYVNNIDEYMFYKLNYVI